MRFGIRTLRELISFAAATPLFLSPVLRAAPCAEDANRYSGYTVRHVEIRSPIQFFAAVTFGFDTLKVQLPLQDGQSFSIRTMSDGVPVIRDYIQSAGWDGFQKVKIVLASGRPENCDAAARTLDVVYTVFTNIYRPYFGRTFEERTAEVERPSTTGAEGGAQGRFLIDPLGGYDRTRRGYGGADLSSSVPLGIFQKVQMHGSGSLNSMIGDLTATGSADPGSAALEHAEWRFGLDYLDMPAGSATLKEAKLAAQFFGATRELRGGGLGFRYGASLEGGHQQTGSAFDAAAPNSSFGALKLYAGATERSGRQTFTASYGAELGTTLSGGLLDFVKHVADLGYTVRFLRENQSPSGDVHKPLDIETRATAGLIQELGGVPAAERFYGGNQVQPFIAGDGWVIPGNPLIRSIPQNRLGGLGPGGALGGTRFYSGNLTVSKVVWGRPLLPKELAQDPEFLPQLHGAINTAIGALTDAYKVDDPAYKTAAIELDVIADRLRQLGTVLDTLPGTADLKSQAATVSRILDAIKGGRNNQFAALVNLQLPRLEKQMADLEKLFPGAGLSGLRASLETSRNNIKTALAAVNIGAAETRAKKDFSAAQRVLNAFLYELNVYSIAPVAIFDMARVWPTGTGNRYAAGGGVRVSMINVNFTLGYAVNPERRPGEGAGALFVNLDVTDLFH